MASSNDSNRSGGIGFSGMLAILFIGLKLTGYIDWPWWAVLAPIWAWIPILLLLAAIVIVIDSIEDK